MRLNENIHMASVSIKVCTDFRHKNTIHDISREMRAENFPMEKPKIKWKRMSKMWGNKKINRHYWNYKYSMREHFFSFFLAHSAMFIDTKMRLSANQSDSKANKVVMNIVMTLITEATTKTMASGNQVYAKNPQNVYKFWLKYGSKCTNSMAYCLIYRCIMLLMLTIMWTWHDDIFNKIIDGIIISNFWKTFQWDECIRAYHIPLLSLLTFRAKRNRDTECRRRRSRANKSRTI